LGFSFPLCQGFPSSQGSLNSTRGTFLSKALCILFQFVFFLRGRLSSSRSSAFTSSEVAFRPGPLHFYFLSYWTMRLRPLDEPLVEKIAMSEGYSYSAYRLLSIRLCSFFIYPITGVSSVDPVPFIYSRGISYIYPSR
jgi:hypothetical protein